MGSFLGFNAFRKFHGVVHSFGSLKQGAKATWRHLRCGRCLVADGGSRCDTSGDAAEVDAVGWRGVVAPGILAMQAACELLAPVYRRFTEGADTADLQDAKTVLTKVGALA